jgi:hypothetical protein
MTNSYGDTMLEGESAYTLGFSRHDNPFTTHTTAWYAWDCGWRDAQREATKPQVEPDLELEAALVAWQDSVSK